MFVLIIVYLNDAMEYDFITPPQAKRSISNSL